MEMQQEQHSQHRKGLLSAGTNSDPDRKQGLQQECWYRANPGRAIISAGISHDWVLYPLPGNQE